MSSIEVKTIGFDRPSRCGKGTQIESLSRKFSSIGIPFLVVRGDGTKQRGVHDKWWKDMNRTLKEGGTDLNWATAAYKLAQEMIHIRDVVLPGMAKTLNSPIAFLLVDRTLLSRSMIPREQNPDTVVENLYPDEARQTGIKVTPEMVCPDIIFNISVNTDLLLQRLDPKDEKYEFRKKMILKRSEWYKNAKDFIPSDLRSRVVEVDGAKDVQVVFKQIWEVLIERYPEYLKTKKTIIFTLPVQVKVPIEKNI